MEILFLNKIKYAEKYPPETNYTGKSTSEKIRGISVKYWNCSQKKNPPPKKNQPEKGPP